MNDDDLLSCPFCGGTGKLYHDTTADYERQWTWLIECSVCECSLTRSAKDAAIAAWNKRTTNVIPDDGNLAES